jgi:hypothetical protein
VTNEEEYLSKVVPYLLAILVCDSGTIDLNSGKKTLVGIFDRIIAGKFPTSRWLSVYFKLSDAEGKYRFRVQYAQVKTDEILAEAETQDAKTIKSRLDIFDSLISFPVALQIPEAGQYEFRLYVNSMFLGRIAINAVPRDKREG